MVHLLLPVDVADSPHLGSHDAVEVCGHVTLVLPGAGLAGELALHDPHDGSADDVFGECWGSGSAEVGKTPTTSVTPPGCVGTCLKLRSLQQQ